MAIWGRKSKQGFTPVSATEAPQHQHHHPRMGDLTVGDYANGMPNIRLGEMFKAFMRQLVWLIPLALIGSYLAWTKTSDFKREYFGDSRLLVQLGDEYVYQPVGGSAQGNGLMTTIDTITLTEAAIMKNGQIIDQVIGEIGPRRIAPDAWAKVLKYRKANNLREEKIALMEMRNEVDSAYIVMPRPKSSIIDVMFKHEDPDVAVETTNAFVDAYVASRSFVFDEGSLEIIAERRKATDNQLRANERAIARFLNKNDISDFDSEQKGLRERTETLKANLNATRASIAETEASLAQVEDQLRATPETIDLYRDDRASQRVAQAELELRQLMAKYLPTSDPVRQKQTELAELKSLQNSYGGKAAGGRRVGPNPVQQALLTQRNTLAATADSLREKEFTLQRQLNSADSKVRRLTSLSPEFQNLLRERETLNLRLNTYNSQEQEALVDAQQVAASAENVKVVSKALYPNKGRNMRLLMFALAAGAWIFTLVMFAMLRVFLDPRLYATPGPDLRARADVVPDVAMAATEPEYVSNIPEAVPAYDPGPVPGHAPSVAPMPNPYEQPAVAAAEPAYVEPAYETAQASLAQPFADNYGQYASGGYDHHNTYPADAYTVQEYSQPASPDYGTTASADPYATQADANPYQQGYADTAYAEPAFNGNAALDLSHNPYLTGEAQAGALDEYGRPLPPPVT